jgi:hypothetical protein
LRNAQTRYNAGTDVATGRDTLSTDWQRVAEVVRERRLALGLKQSEVPGVSAASWRKLEGAKQTSYKLFLLRAVERALEWPPGSIDAIAAGEEVPTQAPGLEVRLNELEARFDRIESQLSYLLDQRQR